MPQKRIKWQHMRLSVKKKREEGDKIWSKTRKSLVCKAPLAIFTHSNSSSIYPNLLNMIHSYSPCLWSWEVFIRLHDYSAPNCWVLLAAIFCQAFPVAYADDWVSMDLRHRPGCEITGVSVCRPPLGQCWTPAQKLQEGVKVPSSVLITQLLLKDLVMQCALLRSSFKLLWINLVYPK